MAEFPTNLINISSIVYFLVNISAKIIEIQRRLFE